MAPMQVRGYEKCGLAPTIDWMDENPDGYQRKGMIIRAYQPGDEDGIICLMSPMGWQHLKSTDHWRWEYRDCPDGHALIQVAEHDGDIIGHYASLPIPMQCDRAVIPAGKVEGSAVDIRYRGAAARKFFPAEENPTIFGKLIQALFAQADQEHTKLLWGFPNDAAVSVQVRLGYDYLKIPRSLLMRPLNPSAVAKRVLAKRVPSKLLSPILASGAATFIRMRNVLAQRVSTGEPTYRVRQVASFDEQIDHLWSRWMKMRHCVTLVRSRKYLSWRFVENPNASYTRWVVEKDDCLTGYLITSAYQRDGYREGSIVDVLVENEEALDALLLRCIDAFKQDKVDVVTVWSIPNNPHHALYERTFQRHGFWISRSSPLHVILRATDGDAMRAYLLDPSHWYLTMAFTEGTF